MPQYTQYFTTSAGSHLNNRCIFTGPQTSTPWPVPEGTTEVHVHVWGGGGGGCRSSYGRGGGGGGYARASLAVTDSDALSITVGGAAGTSSVTVPTQTPGSPISATGGGNATSSDRGAGGAGTVALAPTQCQWYCYTANGGAGGKSEDCSTPAGGGAAGSPRGTGGYGGRECCGGGGGIGGSPGQNLKCYDVGCNPNPSSQCQCCSTVTLASSGSALQARNFSSCYNCRTTGLKICSLYPLSSTPNVVTEIGTVGCSGFYNNVFNKMPCNPTCGTCPVGPAVGNFYTATNSANRSWGDEWFYVEDMAGAAVGESSGPLSGIVNNPYGPAGAGAGGYGEIPAGVLGGGGCNSTAGCAGGQGANSGFSPGTPGMVVIYW